MLKPLQINESINKLFNYSANVTFATRPKHVLIYSLSFVIDVNDFIFVGSLFHISGLRAVKLLSP